MELVRHIVDEAQRLVPQRITFHWQHACKARGALHLKARAKANFLLKKRGLEICPGLSWPPPSAAGTGGRTHCRMSLQDMAVVKSNAADHGHSMDT